MPARQPRREKTASPPPAPTPHAPPSQKTQALARSPWAYLLASIVVLIPCFWQARLQAGDLSSHLYNAWLAQLIQQGRAPGLALANQTTNILFDLILSAGFRAFGADIAQRIAVSIAVLTFVWGSFAFVSAASGRRAWNMLPLVGILAYGWVFHIGFFNFYLSLGACFFALAMVWTADRRWIAAAALVLVVAYIAHALPVFWAIALVAYRFLVRAMPKREKLSMGLALGAMLVARVGLSNAMPTRWSLSQFQLMSGLDQVWVFDPKYLLIFATLLLLCGLAVYRLNRGGFSWATAIPFHFLVLTAVGVLIFPDWVAVPGYKHALAFITERMSLAVSICLCAVLARAEVRRWEQYAMLAATLVFFGFLYHDEKIMNAFEDRLERRVAELPPGQRVISAIDDPALRVNSLTHMIDRVCVGRCFSYANYEPTTAQFRVRVVGPTPMVVSTYDESWRIQAGTYVVADKDLPLYEISMDQNGRLATLSLQAGSAVGVTYWNPL